MSYKFLMGKSQKKRILVIFTGGTFGMGPNLEVQNLGSKELKSWLHEQVPEMNQIAKCDVHVLYNLDSCQFQAEHWFELAAHLHQELGAEKGSPKFDGAVILHGTDTMAHSAAAIACLLSPTPAPVVFTGAQKPLSTLRNDARSNLISALELATQAPKALQNRVMVAFGNQVFLGSRIRKKSARQFAAYDSPRFPVLATIGSEITYHEIINHLPPLKAKKPLLTQFKGTDAPLPQILTVNLSPQFPSALTQVAFLESLDGVLLHLYASGTAPTEYVPFQVFLENAKKLQTPIFAITEREEEVRKMGTYPSGKELEKQNVLWCADLTPEAAFVKAWLLRELKANLSKKEYYQWLQKNWSVALSDESTG
jgi:L-asparaginase